MFLIRPVDANGGLVENFRANIHKHVDLRLDWSRRKRVGIGYLGNLEVRLNAKIDKLALNG